MLQCVRQLIIASSSILVVFRSSRYREVSAHMLQPRLRYSRRDESAQLVRSEGGDGGRKLHVDCHRRSLSSSSRAQGRVRLRRVSLAHTD